MSCAGMGVGWGTKEAEKLLCKMGFKLAAKQDMVELFRISKGREFQMTRAAKSSRVVC